MKYESDLRILGVSTRPLTALWLIAAIGTASYVAYEYWEGLLLLVTAAVLAVSGWIYDLATGLGKWLHEPTTNESILAAIFFTYYFLNKSFETQIKKLRDLINETENRRRGNWP